MNKLRSSLLLLGSLIAFLAALNAAWQYWYGPDFIRGQTSALLDCLVYLFFGLVGAALFNYWNKK